MLEDAPWRDTLSGQPWTFEDWKTCSTNIVQWTAENNHCLLARLLVNSGKALSQENIGLLIEGAVAQGFTELTNICLGSDNVPQAVLDSSLQAAVDGGHLAIVERQLLAKADVNAADEDGWTALQAAAEGGHLAIVERLLQAEADVKAADEDGWTALQAAV